MVLKFWIQAGFGDNRTDREVGFGDNLEFFGATYNENEQTKCNSKN